MREYSFIPIPQMKKTKAERSLVTSCEVHEDPEWFDLPSKAEASTTATLVFCIHGGRTQAKMHKCHSQMHMFNFFLFCI